MRRKVGKKLFVVFEEKNKKEYESKENNTHFVHKINLQKTDDHLRRNVGEKDKKWKHRFLKKENKACLVYGCVECRYIQSSRWAKNPYFFGESWLLARVELCEDLLLLLRSIFYPLKSCEYFPLIFLLEGRRAKSSRRDDDSWVGTPFLALFLYERR